MNCGNVDAKLSDYLDEELPFSEMADVRQHLAGCSYCKTKYDDLMDALRDLRATEPIEAPANFETTVITRTRLVPAQPMPGRRPFVVPMWVPIAAVAALLVIFIPVVLSLVGEIGKHGDKMSELEAKLRELNNRPAPPPAAVKTAPSLDPAYVISQFVQEVGLVPYEDTVVPQSIHEHILKGDWYVNGKWLPKAEAIKALEGPKVPAPVAPDEKETVKNWLEANNYIKVGDVFLPANYKEMVKSGQIPVERPDPTVAVDKQKIIDEFMKENDLVLLEGRVMTKMQAAELATARTIDAPSKIVTHVDVTTLLTGLKIGIPVSHQDIALYPLTDESKPHGEYLSLREAMTASKVIVTENQTFAIQVENKGSAPVLIPGGALFSGGAFERMCRVDTMVAPGSKILLGVYDVHPFKFSSKTRFGNDSGRYMAPISLCRAARQGYGQSAVWAGTIDCIETLGGNKKDPSLEDLFASKPMQEAYAQVEKALGDFAKRCPDARGVAVAIGSQIVLVKIFATPELLATQLPMILSSCVADQMLQARGLALASDVLNVSRELKRFIEGAYLIPATSSEIGLDLLRQNESIGIVCQYKGKPVSMTLYAADRSRTSLSDLLTVTSRVSGDKMDKVLLDYEALAAGATPAQKITVLREMGAIGAPQTTRSLVKFFNDKDFEVRKAAVNVIADRKDVAAVPDLIKLFNDSKKDMAMLDVTAKAMARIPDSRCAAELVGALRKLDAQAAGVVLEAVPDATKKADDRRTLENTLVTLIGFWDYYYQMSLDPNAQIDAKTRLHVREVALRASDAIKGLTGKEFTTPSDAKIWWGKNKDEFLKKAPEH